MPQKITKQQYMSGKVRRWHTHANLNQTVADHSWGVAAILLLIHPDPSQSLLREAIFHDCGELIIGDIPAPSKLALIADLREALAKEEDSARLKMGIPRQPLTAEEAVWLEMADKLEAYIFIMTSEKDDSQKNCMLLTLELKISELAKKLNCNAEFDNEAFPS